MPAWRGTGRNSGEAGPLTRAKRQAKFNCKLGVLVADEVTRLQTPPCVMQQCLRRSKLLTVHDRSGRRKQYKCKWKSTRESTSVECTCDRERSHDSTSGWRRRSEWNAIDHARGQKNKNARTVPCARSHDWCCDRKIGTKSATVIPKSDRKRGPGRNLKLGIVVVGGGGGVLLYDTYKTMPVNVLLNIIILHNKKNDISYPAYSVVQHGSGPEVVG